MTQTGTRQPSGMKMVLGTISPASMYPSDPTTPSRTRGCLARNTSLTSELSSRRTDVPWIFLSFGQLSPHAYPIAPNGGSRDVRDVASDERETDPAP